MKKVNLILIVGMLFISCKKKIEKPTVKQEVKKSELFISANNFFKPISSIDEKGYTKISQDKVNLGKKLYKDPILSKDENISCNSCHKLDGFGVDNLAKSPGDLGKLGGRNSPMSFYAALHFKQFWDGRAEDVEEQAGGPVLNPVEHNIPSKEFLEKRLRKLPEYQEMFRKAFPKDKEPVTFDNMRFAIASFEKQLMPESKFDKFLEGDESVLNEDEKKGLKSFMDNACITCHNGVALGGQMFQKFGVFEDYWKHTKSSNIDEGMYEVTKKDEDKYIFKVPGLRNIAKTYPYFHDGSVDSLENAVAIMAKTQLNKDLSTQEVSDIVAFLNTLTADIDTKYKN